MIPGRLLLCLAFAGAASAVLLYYFPGLEVLWGGGMLALLLLASLDALLARQLPAVRVERQMAGVWAVDSWNSVTVTLHNEDSRRLRLAVIDDYPTHWELEGLPHHCVVAAGAWVAINYRLRPVQRGDGQFGPVYLRLASPLRLWQVQWRLGALQTVKVFPDFSRLLGQTLHATDRRAPTVGTLRRRRRGEGTDFRQLREYRQGDSLRSIDWKATARQQKPISREYQEERDQQVVFLLDTGRRMLACDDSMSHFDHALHAVLTLGFVAQKQGDAVGLMSFGGDRRWLAPQKGRTGLDRLLAGVYDLQAHEVAPDYVQAAVSLLQRLRKRAFVVLITNLRDEDDEAMRTACELLAQKHLVMCASLREKALDAAAVAPVEQFSDALRLSAAELYLQQRRSAILSLGMRAGHLIDVTPDRLALTLVRRYLDIKESGQL